jgi:hypothetical protein
MLTQQNNNNTPDSKKEEYRKYLERTGVLDALTKVLVGLYEEPERPNNAIDYIKRYMGAPPNVDIEGLKKSNEALKHENELLKRQVEELNKTMQQQQQPPSVVAPTKAASATVAAATSVNSTIPNITTANSN